MAVLNPTIAKNMSMTQDNVNISIQEFDVHDRIEKGKTLRFSLKDDYYESNSNLGEVKNERRGSNESLDRNLTRWSVIKQQFDSNHLNPLFKTYTHKTNHGYLSAFLILMFVLCLTHFTIVFIENMEENSIPIVLLDLIVYLVAIVLSVLGLFLSERYIKAKPKLLKIICAGSFFVMFVMNIIVPIYHYHVNRARYRPAYTTLFILSCYVFFNIRSNIKAASLGAIMSVVNLLVLLEITYKNDGAADDGPRYIKNFLSRIGSDVIYLFCINAFGIYFRLMTEIMKRMSFLNRRNLVQSTLTLEYEKKQGEALMSNIIPTHAMKRLKERMEPQMRKVDADGMLYVRNPWQLDIQKHENVTILYADIVNFTKMSTKLKSIHMVETLNELFGRFDDASESLDVLRVKFLGDCYYCVAGLEPAIENHAEACVALGLKMIKIIQDVKRSRDLPIDMRIGIHTGDIYSGVIGSCKWQFDIWSKAVNIANRMETTGQAGKVHLTKQTKDQLTQNYNMTPSNAGSKDPLLQQNNIETFLITPEPDEVLSDIYIENLRRNVKENGTTNETANGHAPQSAKLSHKRSSLFIQNRDRSITKGMNFRIGQKARKSLFSVGSDRDSQSYTSRRTATAFMDSNIKRYHERLKRTDDKIKKSIEDISLTKFDQWIKFTQINPITLTFRDLRRELNYIKLPDPLFKFCIIGVIVISVCIVLIPNISNPHWSSPVGYISMLFLIFVIFPLSWSNYIWKCCAEFPKGKFVKRYLRGCSSRINDNVLARIIIYIVIWCICSLTVILNYMAECRTSPAGAPNTTMVYFRQILTLLEHQEDECVVQWYVTEAIALVIITNFTFLKIHIWLKLLFAIVLTVLYSTLIWNYNDRHFDETYNNKMATSIAHILNIVFLTISLHIIDRQTDFMSRLDQMMIIEETEQKAKVIRLQKQNEKLINNILPIHVAKLYMDLNREEGNLFYEEYPPSKPVAVMFAAILLEDNELDDQKFLKCMNAKIEDFDQILMRKYENKIEKIKIANWTYMAACGLDSGKRNSFYGGKALPGDRESVVIVTLLKFAAEILKLKHDTFLDVTNTIKLRIGLSCGEVTAGVVGSKKPLYDIWGDSVNMASRMESTGVPGTIQVTESTADVLKKLGYSTQFRGEIKIKGKDARIPTYFVDVNENGELVKIPNEDLK